MGRRASCIGFDEDNLEWLRQRPEGMAEFLNRLVRAYRNKKTVQSAVGNGVSNTDEEVELRTTVARVKEEIVRSKQEQEDKIRAYLRDFDHILYMAKTQRKFTKADLCRIKDELYFSKYNVDVTIDEIKKVLRSELDVFDVSEYEKKRGIMRD